MTNVRDIFDIRGGMDGLTRRGIEQVFTEELGKVALKSRGDGLMGGNLLPYIQGRDAAAQGKMPLLMMTSQIPPGGRGFSIPAFAHARAHGVDRPPLGGMQNIADVFGKRHFTQHPLTSGVVHEGFIEGQFELFDRINKAKNPEKFVDELILKRIEPGGYRVNTPVHHLIPQTEENAIKLQREFNKLLDSGVDSINAQRLARAEVTKDVLKTMSFDDKLAMVIPRMALHQDMLRYDPKLFEVVEDALDNVPMGKILEDLKFMDKGNPTELGKQVLGVDVVDGKDVLKIPTSEQLRSILQTREEARLSGSVAPFMDALESRFTMAHELDHVRDAIDLQKGQFGKFPLIDLPEMRQRIAALNVDRGPGGYLPTRTRMERMADLAGFRSIADVTSSNPNLKSGKEGIPRRVLESRLKFKDDPRSLYRHGYQMAEQAFSTPKFAPLRGRLPMRAFGVLGAIGLLGMLAAGGAAVASGGNRGNA